MSKSTKFLPGIVRRDPPDGLLTEDDIRAWLETFYVSEVDKADILKRLTRQAAFWRG